MKRLIPIILISLSASVFAEGLNISKPDAVGGNLVGMTQDRSTLNFKEDGLVIGPGIEFFLKYDISPKMFLTIGTGFNTVKYNIPLVTSSTTTLIPTLDLRAAYKPMSGSPFSPFLMAGVNAFGWQKSTKVNGKTFDYPDKRVYDGALLIGGGAEYVVNEKVSLQASGDLRFVFTSDEDPQPQYWVAKAGLTYQLNPAAQEGPNEEIEYPLGDDELASLDDLFQESDSDDNFDDLDLLFQPEESGFSATDNAYDTESDLAYGTEAGTLQNRISELKQKMDAGFMQLQTLENQVMENEKVITDLTGGSSGKSSGEKLADVEFKNKYDLALQKYNTHQYKQAIPEFTNLMASNPDHRLASNCQYWIGECYNGLGDYQKAIQAFNSVLDYRSSYKFDDALIMTGVCSMKIGDNENAKQKFQELVNRYPDSEYAPKAMRYLGKF